MSFESIDRDLLYRQALEDFAVEVHHKAGHEKIVKALEEAGVTWDIYLQAHPEAAPAPAAEVIENPAVEVPTSTPSNERHRSNANVITSSDVAPTPVVKTKEAEVKVGTADLYLVKMNRENPYFEFRGSDKLHKFTQDNPFAIMSADDANRITSSEDGFAIATPAEANEYYS